jgi:hypothetical protein
MKLHTWNWNIQHADNNDAQETEAHVLTLFLTKIILLHAFVKYQNLNIPV